MKIKAELTFPGKLKEEPIICNLCKNFDVVVSIIEASFSTDTGWALLVIQGEDAVLKKAYDYLKENHVEIDKLEKVL